MISYHHEEDSVVVAVSRTRARAEFLQMTLAAHGLAASYAPCSMIPSVDFVQGMGVSVRTEDEAKARSILEALGLADDGD